MLYLNFDVKRLGKHRFPVERHIIILYIRSSFVFSIVDIEGTGGATSPEMRIGLFSNCFLQLFFLLRNPLSHFGRYVTFYRKKSTFQEVDVKFQVQNVPEIYRQMF